jgi:hypothetical protein
MRIGVLIMRHLHISSIVLGTLLSVVTPFFCSESRAQDTPQRITSKVEDGIVTDVLRAEDDGYKYILYIVMWRGSKVGVEDDLSTTNFKIGDRINFMVVKWTPAANKNGGQKVLAFKVVSH